MNPRRHPLWRVAQQHWLAVIAILLLLTAVDLGLGMAAGGRRPMREAAPVWKLEVLPWDAGEILARWQAAGALPLAAEAVAWDFAFIAGWASALSIACLAFARRGGWFERWGGRFGWLALLAGALDAVENVGLLELVERAIRGAPLGRWPWITAAFSWSKWALVAAIAAFLAAALASALREETSA